MQEKEPHCFEDATENAAGNAWNVLIQKRGRKSGLSTAQSSTVLLSASHKWSWLLAKDSRQVKAGLPTGWEGEWRPVMPDGSLC